MKKLAVLVVILLGFVLVFTAGCSKKEDTDTLIVGIDDAFPPMTFHDKNTDAIVGFDVDLGEAIAKKIGVKLKWQPSDWKGIVQSLKTKKIDMVICGMTITEDRKKEIAFSEPYLNAGISIAVNKGDTSVDIKDLSKNIIGVQTGSSGAEGLENLGYKTNVKFYDAYPAAFNDLAVKRADGINCIAVDTVVGAYLINEQGNKFSLLPEKLITEQYGIGMRQEDKELVEKVNKALKELKEDGTLKQIAEKWFGKDNITGLIPE